MTTAQFHLGPMSAHRAGFRRRCFIAVAFGVAAAGCGGGDGGGGESSAGGTPTVPVGSASTNQVTTNSPLPVCANPFAVGPFVPTDFSRVARTLAKVEVYPEASATESFADYRFTDTQLDDLMADFVRKMSQRTNADDVLKDVVEVYRNPAIIQNSPDAQLRAGLAMGLAVPDEAATRRAMKALILNPEIFLGIQEAPAAASAVEHDVFVWFPNTQVNRFSISFKRPYMREHPALIASFIFHELAHHDSRVNKFEEMTLNALSDLANMKVFGRYPALLDSPSTFVKEFVISALARVNSSDGITARLRTDADVLPGTKVDENAKVRDYAGYYDVKESPYPASLFNPANGLLELYLKTFTKRPELAGSGADVSFDADTAAAVDSGINPTFLSDQDVWAFVKAARLAPVKAPTNCTIPATR